MRELITVSGALDADPSIDEMAIVNDLSDFGANPSEVCVTVDHKIAISRKVVARLRLAGLQAMQQAAGISMKSEAEPEHEQDAALEQVSTSSGGPGDHRASAAVALQAAARGWLARERMLSAGMNSDDDLDERQGDESTHAQFLSAVPLMATMTPDELEQIAAAVASEHYEDEYILEQGDEGASLYIVKNGIAVVEKAGCEVTRYQRGDYFGERALIKDGT